MTSLVFFLSCYFCLLQKTLLQLRLNHRPGVPWRRDAFRLSSSPPHRLLHEFDEVHRSIFFFKTISGKLCLPHTQVHPTPCSWASLFLATRLHVNIRTQRACSWISLTGKCLFRIVIPSSSSAVTAIFWCFCCIYGVVPHLFFFFWVTVFQFLWSLIC